MAAISRIGVLYPFVARTDEERRVLLNLAGPTWEGNQVWFDPRWRRHFRRLAAALRGQLLGLLRRDDRHPPRADPGGRLQVSRQARGQALARGVGLGALFVGGFVPSLVLGVAVGNGVAVPFRLDETLRITYEGNFFGLLTPFALIAGLVSLSMIATQGATLIAGRTSGELAERARKYWSLGSTRHHRAVRARRARGAVPRQRLPGHRTAEPVRPVEPPGQERRRRSRAWRANYSAMPWMIVAPVLAILGSLVAWWGLGGKARLLAYLGSSAAIFGIIATAGLSLFPFLLPSSVDPGASLTVWDASSSQLTLFTMLLATVVFLPIVLVYTAWVFRVMRGPVTSQSLGKNPNAY